MRGPSLTLVVVLGGIHVLTGVVLVLFGKVPGGLLFLTAGLASFGLAALISRSERR